MKKFTLAGAVFIIVMLFSFTVHADSPITSTQFSKAYLDYDVVKNAKGSGVLDLTTAQYLASENNPIDVKAAVMNALGWNSNGKDNAEKYSEFILGKSVKELKPEELSGNDAFCIGYLKALDNYFKPNGATPFLGKATKEIPNSYTVGIISALVNAQSNLGNYKDFWESLSQLESNKATINDMRPDAIKIILDYMKLNKYFGIDKNTIILEDGKSTTANFAGHSGPYTLEQLEVYTNNEYENLDASSFDSNILVKITDNAVNFTGVRTGLYRATFADKSGAKIKVQVLVASPEITERVNNSIILMVGSPKAFINGMIATLDKYDPSLAPLSITDRTLIPVRFVSEKLGASVDWNAETSTATITISGRTIKITESSDKMIVDDREVILNTPAVSRNSRLYIPLRAFVEEGMGKKVYYNQGLIAISGYDNIFDPSSDTDVISELMRTLSESVPENRNNNIKVLLNIEPVQMNSLLATDNTSHVVQNHINEGLMRKGKDGKPVPGIAESYETSSDGLVWTFHLRDSKWSDGTNITAKDFEFAFLEALKKETGSEYAYLFYVFKNGRAYNTGAAGRGDVGVKAVDDKTLVLALEQPTPYLLEQLTFGNFAPIKQDFYEAKGSTYGKDADKLLYSGPWIMKKWVSGSNITLIKNPYYWNNENIKLNEIDFYFSTNTSVAYMGYISSRFDVVNVGTNELEYYEAKGNNVMDYPDGATFYLEFNTKDSYLKNANIRKALSYSIDRNYFISQTRKYKYEPAFNFTNPVVSGENESFSKELGSLIRNNDFEEARNLLSKGLQELGLESLPEISILVDNTGSAISDGQYMASIWKKNLGINVKVVPVAFKDRLQAMSSKNFQIVLAGWSADFNDPISFLDIFETGNGNNHTSFSNSEYDSLLNKIRKESNSKVRMDMLKELEKKLMDNMPIAPLYYRHRYYVAKPYVQGLVRTWGQDIDLYWTSLSD